MSINILGSRLIEVLNPIIPRPKMGRLQSVSIALFIMTNRSAFGSDFDCEGWLKELETSFEIKIADKMKCRETPGITLIRAIILYEYI